MRTVLGLIVLAANLGIRCGVAADAPKVLGARVQRGRRSEIIVNFDNPAPSPAAADQWSWIVYQKLTSGGKTSVAQLRVSKADTGGLAPASQEKKIVLTLDQPVAGEPQIKEVDITIVTPDGLVPVSALKKPAELGTGTRSGPEVVAPGKSKTDSDIYFNGSYTGVLGGDPVFNIDTFAGYMRAIRETRYYGKFGLYGQAVTKSSPVADPNSFMAYLVYQYVFSANWWHGFQPPIFNYRVFGSEFDRTAKELNLINSPIMVFPIRLGHPPENLSDKISAWPLLHITMGTEFVDVRKSVLAPVDKWHTRGLLGANLATGYGPKKKWFDSVQLTSSWVVRLPSAPEIFYDDKFAPIDPATHQKNTKKTPAMLGTQPRHFFDTKLTYNYTAWGGVTFEHTYGSLPPAYNKTDQSFTFGLCFTLQQASYGRTSILRP